MTRVTTRSFAGTLSTMAPLTVAQHSLLKRVAEHETPVTVSDLAAKAELHVSSARETLDALMGMGLVSREQLPAQGRGRPAFGYPTTTPTDPAFSALMLNQMTSTILDVLRETNDNPGVIARLIGRKQADRVLETTGTPDHSRFTHLPEGFTLSSHMGEIRMLLSVLGFAVSPLHGHPTSLVMTACLSMHPGDPDPLTLELCRGLVERILERTVMGYASWICVPDVKQPMRVVVTLSERITKAVRETPMLVRFFGGAAEAAEVEELEIPASFLPTAPGVLLGVLTDSRPALAPVLEVSTFLLDRKPVDRNIPLRPGLQLGVLPPFTGGRSTTMSVQICTSIVDISLDPVVIEKAVRRTDCGAFISFIGVVRNHDDGEGVRGIDYSAHSQVEEIPQDLAEGFARREGVRHTGTHHRVGSLHIGDEAMVVVVAAERRSQAFTACSDLIDGMKVRLPIQKKQFRLDGSHEWSGLR